MLHFMLTEGRVPDESAKHFSIDVLLCLCLHVLQLQRWEWQILHQEIQQTKSQWRFIMIEIIINDRHFNKHKTVNHNFIIINNKLNKKINKQFLDD